MSEAQAPSPAISCRLQAFATRALLLAGQLPADTLLYLQLQAPDCPWRLLAMRQPCDFAAQAQVVPAEAQLELLSGRRVPQSARRLDQPHGHVRDVWWALATLCSSRTPRCSPQAQVTARLLDVASPAANEVLLQVQVSVQDWPVHVGWPLAPVPAGSGRSAPKREVVHAANVILEYARQRPQQPQLQPDPTSDGSGPPAAAGEEEPSSQYVPQGQDLAELVTSVSSLYDMIANKPPSDAVLSPQTQPDGAATTSLMALPTEVHRLILRHLLPRPLSALACTSRYFRDLCRAAVPGLHLTLRPHQIESLTWMMGREAGNGGVWLHPGYVALPAEDSNSTSSMMVMDCQTSEIRQYLNYLQSSRGGLLCDDPGLGKTVTVLALLLKTAWPRVARGMAIDEAGIRRDYTDQRFASWPHMEREEWTQRFLNDIARAVNAAAKSFDVDPDVFEHPVDLQAYPDYVQFVSRPISMFDIRREPYSKASAVASDVELMLRNAMSYVPPEQPLHQLAAAVLAQVPEIFLRHCARWRNTISQKQVDSAKPLRNTTLIVAPNLTLAKYWYDQIMRHCSLAMLGGVQLYDWPRKLSDAEMENVAVLIITMTSLSKLQMTMEGFTFLFSHRWLRVIIDEGHAMGRGMNSKARAVIASLLTERKWLVTGTPTPATLDRTGLSHLFGLIHTIAEPPFAGNRQLWKQLVQRPFDQHLAADAIFRLKSVTERVMVRHTKNILATLPHPIVQTIVLPLMPLERDSYNAVVAVIRANLVLTAMEGKTKGKIDSLLHESRMAYAREALLNSRISCCGGMRRRCQVEAGALDSMAARLYAHNVGADRVKVISQRIASTSRGQTLPCERCKLPLLVLLVLPCGCMNCAECVTAATRLCPTCDRPFDVDEFQLLQPGVMPQAFDDYLPLSADFPADAVLQALAAFDDLSAASGIVTSLSAEQQRQYQSGAWSPVETIDLRHAVKQVLGPLANVLNVAAVQATVNGHTSPGGAHGSPGSSTAPVSATAVPNANSNHLAETSEAATASGDSVAGAAQPSAVELAEATGSFWAGFMEEHVAEAAVDMAELPRWARSVLADDLSRRFQQAVLEHTKARHIALTVLSLLRESAQQDFSAPHSEQGAKPAKRARFADEGGGVGSARQFTPGFGNAAAPTTWQRPWIKCIVFSQFGLHDKSPLSNAGDCLMSLFGTKSMARYHGSTADQELRKFQHVDDCMFLLLGKDGAVGLDLSFVTHIFFIDEIFDEAVEAQVIARAWRMGCRRSVIVHKLVMAGTLEETMMRINTGREKSYLAQLGEEEEDDVDMDDGAPTDSIRRASANRHQQSDAGGEEDELEAENLGGSHAGNDAAQAAPLSNGAAAAADTSKDSPQGRRRTASARRFRSSAGRSEGESLGSSMERAKIRYLLQSLTFARQEHV